MSEPAAKQELARYFLPSSFLIFLSTLPQAVIQCSQATLPVLSEDLIYSKPLTLR